MLDSRLLIIGMRMRLAKPQRSGASGLFAAFDPQAPWVACVAILAEELCQPSERREFMEACGITLHHLKDFPELNRQLWGDVVNA